MKTLFTGMVALSLMACVSWEKNDTHHYELWIDESFSDEQANQIIAAATEWQVKTGNFITFSGTTDPYGNDTIAVHAVSDGWNLNRACDATNELGCEISLNTHSTIYMPSNLTGELFSTTAKHELGHSLGANHIASGNVMCADSGCASSIVECGDVKEVCSHWGWGCSPLTMPACQ